MGDLVLVIGEGCHAIVEALLGDGYDVVWAPDVTAGLAEVGRAPPSLVVAHLASAEANLALTGRLVAVFGPARVPVMMKMPSGDPAMLRKALQCGVSGFLRESDEPEETLPRVRSLCRQAHYANLVASQKALLERRVEELLQASTDLKATRSQLEMALQRGPVVMYSREAQPGAGPFTSAEALDSAALTFVDGHVYTVFGYRPQELLASEDSWRALVHPRDRKRLASRGRWLMTNGHHACRYRLRHAAGTYRWVHDEASLVRNHLGDAVAVVGCLRDGTPERTASELRHRNRGLVRRSQRFQGAQQLAGSVAHDLNNLLTAIVGHCQLAERALPDGHRSRESLEQILAAAERAKGSTRWLVRIARDGEKRPQTVSVNAVLRATAKLMGPLLGPKINLKVALRRGLPPVRLDRRQLEQLVLNLAVNARDAMANQGGALTIRSDLAAAGPRGSMGEPSHSVVIEVSDSGCGMNDQVLARCFEPFFTTKSASKGTGLGLYSVLQTAQRWGGCVTVETELGRGTTFRVLLPSSPSAASAARSSRVRQRSSPPCLFVEGSASASNAEPASGTVLRPVTILRGLDGKVRSA